MCRYICTESVVHFNIQFHFFIQEELGSESVERVSINTEAAFKVFKGKSIATGRTGSVNAVSRFGSVCEDAV